jgi:hypothetical protein
MSAYVNARFLKIKFCLYLCTKRVRYCTYSVRTPGLHPPNWNWLHTTPTRAGSVPATQSEEILRDWQGNETLPDERAEE